MNNLHAKISDVTIFIIAFFVIIGKLVGYTYVCLFEIMICCLYLSRIKYNDLFVPSGWLLLTLSMLFSFVNGLFIGGVTRTFIRDIYYFVIPLTNFYTGYFLSQIFRSKSDVLTALFLSSTLSAFISLLYSLVADTQNGQINGYFYNYMVLFPIVLFLTRPRIWTFPREHYFTFLISSLFCIYCSTIEFSRTLSLMIINCIILFLFSKSVRKKYLVIRFTVAVLFAFLFGALFYYDRFDFFIMKLKRIAEELSSNSAYWSDIDVSQNWRGFEVNCVKESFLQSNLYQQIFGQGFSALLNVHGFEYLVTSEVGGIPTIHNGYYLVLFKNGILGLIGIFVFYLCNLYKSLRNFISHRDNYISCLFAGITLNIIVVSTVNGGLFGPTGMFEIIFPLGLIVGHLTRKRRYSLEG